MILVIAEQQGGTLNRASWETVAAAQQTGQPVKIAVFGDSVGEAAAALAAAAVDEVLIAEHHALAAYTADGAVMAVAGLIAAERPDHVFLPHTYQTRDFAPALAVRLGWALVTDCVGLKPDAGGLLFVRPVFQGRLYADIAVQGQALVTFQIGAVRADLVAYGAAPAPARPAAATVDAAQIRQKPDAPFREARQAVDLSQAERIVAVGRGIKEQDQIALAEQLAAAMGAELGASRPICDAGWLPMDRQIGSSGQTVSPKLYIALGISGAIQHLVGMKGARTVVAINKDPDAPIFETADYGIVGDLFDIVPALIKELQG
jgi:electron transfer flavoprotein alpha subunit